MLRYVLMALICAFCCHNVMAQTVTDVGSGETYTTLQAWEDWLDDQTPGTYTANLTSDVTGSVVLLGQSAGTWDITIQGNLQGSTRRTVDGSSDVIRCADANIDTLTIQDVNIDATSTANYAIYNSGGDTTINVKRVTIYDTVGDGIRFNASTTTTGNFENVLIYNAGGQGFNSACVTAGTVYTFKNCGVFKSTGRGFFIQNNSNVTHNYYNCIAMGSGSDDFEDGYTDPTSNVISCVSEDASATAANHDATTNSVANQSTSGPFTNYAGNDFHLTNTAANLWSITVDSGNTPAQDLDYVTRSADDTGPYEYMSAGGSMPIFQQQR